MKITSKDLAEWVEQNITIRHKGVLYKMRHQGLTAEGKPNGYVVKTKRYFLMPLGVGSGVRVYHKGRGVYGLETNRRTV